MRAGSSWRYLLTLYTVACLIEAMLGQMGAFTPLYLPRLGIAPQDVAGWTGAIVSISSPALSGCRSCPSGALADRYARQPVLVRAFVMHLVAGIIAMLAANIWLFLLARAVMSLDWVSPA